KDIQLKPNILIAGITRGRKAIIPSGEDSIQADDRVVVIAAEHKLFDLDDILLQ
ncbi:MAG: Trk system potassium transporter TrkA, partial [Clostridia bacterium]|nr:Trk system potassium transporter TrkA [Clostridia bacterium]